MLKPQVIKYMIHAADMDRAVAFYIETMGLEESFISPHWSELKFGDAVIGLHGGGDGTPNPTGLSFQYEDVVSVFKAALDAGASQITFPEQREGEPILLGSLRDPEGNEIMLTQYVG